MASTELLKMKRSIDGNVIGVDDRVKGVEEKVQDVRGGMHDVGDKVQDVNDRVQVIDDKFDRANRSSSRQTLTVILRTERASQGTSSQTVF